MALKFRLGKGAVGLREHDSGDRLDPSRSDDPRTLVTARITSTSMRRRQQRRLPTAGTTNESPDPRNVRSHSSRQVHRCAGECSRTRTSTSVPAPMPRVAGSKVTARATALGSARYTPCHRRSCSRGRDRPTSTSIRPGPKSDRNLFPSSFSSLRVTVRVKERRGRASVHRETRKFFSFNLSDNRIFPKLWRRARNFLTS